jgi:ATP-dependent Clp protease protease subunit
MNELMAKYTGQTLEAIESAVERDKFFGADEAKAYGLVDEVFEKRPAPGEEDSTHQANAA